MQAAAADFTIPAQDTGLRERLDFKPSLSFVQVAICLLESLLDFPAACLNGGNTWHILALWQCIHGSCFMSLCNL